jgi:hypothetical protein
MATITDRLADTMMPAQKEILAMDADDYSSADAYWREGSENKLWKVSGKAQKISPNRLLVWIETDEAGIEDVDIVEGENEDTAAIRHAHRMAADLDCDGPHGYAMRVAAKWQRDQGLPAPADETIETVLSEWVDHHDSETRTVAETLIKMI